MMIAATLRRLELGNRHPNDGSEGNGGANDSGRPRVGRPGRGGPAAPPRVGMDELIELRRSPRRRDAEQLALVLAAVGIDSRLVVHGNGAGLWVATSVAMLAEQQLAAYEDENRPAPPAPPARRRGAAATALFAILLLFFFGAQRRASFGIDWAAAGAVQAGLVQTEEWWRTITALTLHVDHAHLVGNLAAGLVFGALAAELLGAGLAWLAILLAGGLGNLLNAELQAPSHAAIGASTALFGALGIVSGCLRQRRIVPWRGGIRRWAPLSAGILLLVYLGFGDERTDVGAHVAGFAVGGAIGLALGRSGHQLPHGPVAQWGYGAAALGLLALAWLLALLHAG